MSDNNCSTQPRPRVVEGKMFYEKRWYRRGQSIIVEPRQGDKYPAMISAIGESHKEKPEF